MIATLTPGTMGWTLTSPRFRFGEFGDTFGSAFGQFFVLEFDRKLLHKVVLVSGPAGD